MAVLNVMKFGLLVTLNVTGSPSGSSATGLMVTVLPTVTSASSGTPLTTGGRFAGGGGAPTGGCTNGDD